MDHVGHDLASILPAGMPGFPEVLSSLEDGAHEATDQIRTE